MKLPYITAYEDYLLCLLSSAVNQLSDEYQNTHKNNREKPYFSMQKVNSAVRQRNGCIYMAHKQAFRLRLLMQMPLINATWLHLSQMEVFCLERMAEMALWNMQNHLLPKRNYK